MPKHNRSPFRPMTNTKKNIPSTEVTTEEKMLILRKQAMHRLEGTPPYQPCDPLEVRYDMGFKRTATRSFRGETKRERAVLALLTAGITRSGLPLEDNVMKSLVRRALILSEFMHQELNAQREKDMEQMARDILAEHNPEPAPAPEVEEPTFTVKELPDEDKT